MRERAGGLLGSSLQHFGITRTDIQDKKIQEREERQTSQWSHAEGLGGSPSKQLFLSPSLEPPAPLLFLWDMFDMPVMSVGSCVFFHRAEWLGAGTISCIILLCGPEPLSHCPSLPSCLSSGPSLQERMGDNLLIAERSTRRTIRTTLFLRYLPLAGAITPLQELATAITPLQELAGASTLCTLPNSSNRMSDVRAAEDLNRSGLMSPLFGRAVQRVEKALPLYDVMSPWQFAGDKLICGRVRTSRTQSR
ncbi:hypothetical protein Q8A73_023611 [Channa argus]|nr:hypothetical protein Q8A73_023611 [Channa argus]